MSCTPPLPFQSSGSIISALAKVQLLATLSGCSLALNSMMLHLCEAVTVLPASLLIGQLLMSAQGPSLGSRIGVGYLAVPLGTLLL